MAKAYICEKCGEIFDKNDKFKPEKPDPFCVYSPLIIKWSDDFYCKKKYRDWVTKKYCAKCAHDILRDIKAVEYAE